MRVKIYAHDMQIAADLAATMNLHVSQWDYVGQDWRGITWADVGSVLDYYQERVEGR